LGSGDKYSLSFSGASAWVMLFVANCCGDRGIFFGDFILNMCQAKLSEYLQRFNDFAGRQCANVVTQTAYCPV
jgi:hypothetical protein